MAAVVFLDGLIEAGDLLDRGNGYLGEFGAPPQGQHADPHCAKFAHHLRGIEARQKPQGAMRFRAGSLRLGRELSICRDLPVRSSSLWAARMSCAIASRTSRLWLRSARSDIEPEPEAGARANPSPLRHDPVEFLPNEGAEFHG